MNKAKAVSKTIIQCSYCFKGIKYCLKCGKQFEFDDKIICELHTHRHEDCTDKKKSIVLEIKR